MQSLVLVRAIPSLCTDKPSVWDTLRRNAMAKHVMVGKNNYIRVWLKDQKRYKHIPTHTNNQKDIDRLLKIYNEKEALAILNLQEEEKIAIIEAFEEYILDKEIEIADSTIKEYKLAMRDFCKVVNGNRYLYSLCSADYRKLKRYWSKELGISNTSINNRQRSIKAFLNWCIDQKFIKNMPFKIKSLPEGSKLPRVFTLGEVQEIINVADDEVMKSYIRFSYFSGLRLNTINQTKWIIENDKNYIIILNDKVVANVGKKLPIDSSLIDDWEIINKHQYKRNRITKAFTRYAKLTGSYVKNRKTFHALRHSYGNEWVKSGKPIAVLSKMMMHSSIKVTNDFYIDADPSFFEKHVANA